MSPVTPANNHTPEQSQAPGSRLAALDVLRGIAVLLVLFRHCGLPPLKPTADWTLQTIGILQRGGWVGVDLFFVLSGFLVSGLLFRQQQRLGRIHAWEFLIRRGFKIYPPFWAMIGFIVAYEWFLARSFSPQKLTAELLFVQNYWPALAPHTWSLAVEEHFYLLLAVVMTCWSRVIARGRPQFPGLIVGCCLGIIAINAARLLIAANQTGVPEEQFLHSHLRFDAFLAGVVISYLATQRGAGFITGCARWRWMSLLAGTLCLVPAFQFIRGDLDAPPVAYSKLLFQAILPLNTLGGCLWLLAALGFRDRVSSRNLLAWMGRYSYGIYLWHFPIGFWMTRLVLEMLQYRVSVLTWIGLYLLVSIVSGVLLTKLIEHPALWLRDRLCPDSATKPAPGNRPASPSAMLAESVPSPA